MIFIYILLAIGVIFQILGTTSLHRFPDVYTRLHGATICTTFGSIFLYLGVIIYGLLSFFAGDSASLILFSHTFLIMLILLTTNPTASHAIARAAYKSGLKPKKAVVDDLKEK